MATENRRRCQEHIKTHLTLLYPPQRQICTNRHHLDRGLLLLLLLRTCNSCGNRIDPTLRVQRLWGGWLIWRATLGWKASRIPIDRISSTHLGSARSFCSTLPYLFAQNTCCKAPCRHSSECHRHQSISMYQASTLLSAFVSSYSILVYCRFAIFTLPACLGVALYYLGRLYNNGHWYWYSLTYPRSMYLEIRSRLGQACS